MRVMHDETETGEWGFSVHEAKASVLGYNTYLKKYSVFKFVRLRGCSFQPALSPVVCMIYPSTPHTYLFGSAHSPVVCMIYPGTHHCLGRLILLFSAGATAVERTVYI